MKKKLLTVAISALIGVSSMGTTSHAASLTLYPEMGMVVEIEETDDTENLITVEVGNGNLFSFYDAEEDWLLGDFCAMIMDSKGTEIVYDDEIVSTKYCGFVELFAEKEVIE